jgi:hypothetical protein
MAKSEKKKASLSNFPRLHSLVKTWAANSDIQ